MAAGKPLVRKLADKPRAIDLFSGCGGLTLGLKRAGFDVIGAVEIDASAVRTYSANHKDVVVTHADIRDLSASDLMQKLGLSAGELDLLAGCPPCQGFSTLRTRNGAHRNRDIRNGLIQEMLRFADVFRPKTIMMENVPKLAQHTVPRVL
jgi:DNA (cytosine-5)-methyltransferase 1